MIKGSGFFVEVKQDLLANGWDNAKWITAFRLIILDLGVQLLLHYRLQVRLLKIPFLGKVLSRLVGYFSQILTGCQISAGAYLEGGISIPHPTGIIIGYDVIVGTGTAIYQQVTLGADNKGRYPTVGSRVTIFAGAKVLGGIHLEDDVVVGANSVVISDVKKGGVVAGVPARLLHVEKLISSQHL